MAHQGRILKRIVERQGLTQEAAAEKMGFTSRHGIIRLYKEEVFKEKQIDKAVNAFGVDRSVFDPKEVNQHIGNGNTNTVQVAGNYNDCMAELLKAKDEIIRLLSENSSLKDRLLALQTK